MPNPASAGLPNPAGYTPNLGNGTLIDNVTGLAWDATPAFTVQMLGQAKRACDEKGPGWRLPAQTDHNKSDRPQKSDYFCRLLTPALRAANVRA